MTLPAEKLKPQTKVARNALLALAILLLAVFVWPTRYRMDRMNLGQTDLPVRINRFTGKAEVLYPQGWIVVGADQSYHSSPAEKRLSAEQLRKLDCGARLLASGVLELTCTNNNSDITVNEVTVQVTVWNTQNQQVRSKRPYKCFNSNGLMPQETGVIRDIFDPVVDDANQVKSWSYQIVEAKQKGE